MHTLIALFGLAVAGQQVTPEQLYESATPSVLTLTVDRGKGTVSMGTAFLALGQDVAVTAWHVVKGARSVSAKFSDGKIVTVGGIIDKDPERDIALISVTSSGRSPLKLADGDPKVGSKAFVIGSPKGMEFSISDGIISQTPTIGKGRLYQFTCPVSQGNSGGPLFNQSGQVLGVVSWQLRDAQNLNFAVPARSVTALDPGKKPEPFAVPTTPIVSGPPISVVNDQALTNVFSGLELECQTKDDGTGKTAFVFDSEGTKVTLFQYPQKGGTGPTTNLSLGAGYTGAQETDLAKLNTFNREHRFARAYRDETGTVFVEDDMELAGGVGQAHIAHFISDFRQIVREFEQEVFGQGTSVSQDSFRPSAIGDDRLITQIEGRQIEGILDRLGLKWSKTDDGTGKDRYEVPVAGVKVNLHQFSEGEAAAPTTSLTLTVGVATGKAVPLSVVNDINASARFFKVFTDEDRDPFLVADLDLTGGVTDKTVEAFIRSFTETVPGFLARVVGKD